MMGFYISNILKARFRRWRRQRDKSGEWISTKVENHGSLIIKKGEGFRFSSGHPPDAKEVGKRKNSLLN